MDHNLIPLMAILVSLVAVVPILLSSSHPNLRETWTILAGLIKFGLVLTLLPGAINGDVVEYELLEILPGVPLLLKADPLGVFLQ